MSRKYGGSFAPPGAAAAAHTMPCRARATRGFANPLAPIVPYLASCRSRHPVVPKPGVIRYTGAAYRGVAGHPADCPVQYGGTRTRHAGRRRDLPYGRSSQRRLRSPGCLAKRLAGPRGTAPFGLQDGRRYGRDAPVPPSLWACPASCVWSRPSLQSVRHGCGPVTCGPRNAWTGQCPGRSRFGAGWACLSLPFCFVHASDWDRRSICLSVPFGAVLPVGVAKSLGFWTRPMAPRI